MQTQTGPKIYTGTFHAFKCIIKKESVRFFILYGKPKSVIHICVICKYVIVWRVLQVFGLYKGMASPLYGLAAINAVVFGVQGNVQRRLKDPNSYTSHFLAGSIAGMSQTFICSPMELAKTRMQVQGQGESRYRYRTSKHIYKGPYDCLVKIHRQEGFRGVFRGFWITLLRETPSFGLYFVAYELICRTCSPNPDEDVSMPVLLVAGGCAGMASWLSTYPVDVIKSRIQADMKGRYKNVLDCLRQSYKDEGLMLFTRGLGPTMIRAFPVNAATFATVALVLRLRRDDEDESGMFLFSDLKHHQHGPDHTRWHIAVISNFPSHP